ncbi:translation initiation factor 2 [Aspergillus melleus]|uniref:translation initiation factor 2 n=1 Tax=Aspergillus melleus TaxID=138277 RepID=UPI001E8E5EDF|nr:translation initiation factor IF-2 [Aspergillus melleus]KAH8422804.1 translation initiation factor IF-2 [Aspergillus melleus]
MQRRAVLELSRRHGVDWSCATRRRATAFTPTPTYVPLRNFRSSLISLDSSDSSSSTGTSDNGAGAKPTATGPKFGARWGSRLPQRSAGLSPAEQAMRDALVEKSKVEMQERERALQQKQQRQQQQEQEAQSRQHQPEGRQHDTVLRFQASRWQKNGRPMPFPNRKQTEDLEPDRNLEITTASLPRHLREADWVCPDCQLVCFGKHIRCPSCKAVRPDLNSPPPKKSQFGNDRSTLPIRKIESTGPNDISLAGDQKTRALRNFTFSQGRFTGPRMVFDELEPDTARLASEKKKRSGGQQPRSEPENHQVEEKADPWAWSLSSQSYDTQADDVGPGKSSKGRDGRRQRQHAMEEDEYDEDDQARRRAERKQKKRQKTRQKEVEAAPIPLYLPEFISVSNLADVIGVRPAQFVQQMEEMGFEDVSYSHVLDAETAGLVASEFNFEPIFDTGAEDDLTSAPEPEDKSLLPPRPPVVTIMGHVDHGKTTILDWLRKSSVAASEHGGITQHIGAFSVPMPSGKTITFLDTPGHAAFLEMRRRGADVTDIVVLVIAADDSVKPQTIEAIKHATESNVPIIVAISKIDKENLDLDRVKQDLSVHGVYVEDYGGDVQAIGVSGKTGQGMVELEEAIVTLSEVLDHRADVQGNAEGWVIEATTKSYGRVATALIRRGTLRPGNIIVAGGTWARVRTLRNEAGVSISEATPGMPVEIDGWREQPAAGSEILQAADEQHAKDVVEYRQERAETAKLGEDTAAINEARREIMEKRRLEGSEDGQTGADQNASGPKGVNFIIKADVGGSAEAVMNSITAIGNNEVYANVLRSGVGPVGEFDIEHAAAANGHLISFNMPIDPAMNRMAEMRGLKIMDYNIIYKLIDDVKDILSEKLPPLVTTRVTGEAEIGQIFEITLKSRVKMPIAGCKVRNGVINRARKVRVTRGQEVIYDGMINSLKNVKKDVTEMRKDTECGIGFENWTEFAVGDHIQCYEEIFEKRHL